MSPMLDFVSPHALAGKGEQEAVLLAFSGGMDSSVLLHLLVADSQKKGYPLYLAHVNHGIRGEDALRDREFCRQKAAEYGLVIDILDADIPALAEQNGRSLETEARAVRYAFFADVMEKRGIAVLATAHHADDHLETLLFRLSRGTTAKGLCGIAPAKPFQNGCLVRPLLTACRKEIEAYAKEKRVPYVTDDTNSDISYARNALRAQVVPVLEQMFCDPQRRALVLSRKLREDEAYLEAVAQEFLTQHGENGLEVRAWRCQHPAIGRRVLCSYSAVHTGLSLQDTHLQALQSLLHEGHNGNCVRLPGGYEGILEADRLWIRPVQQPVAVPSFTWPCSYGKQTLESSGIVMEVRKNGENKKVHNLSTTAYINLPLSSAIIGGTLFWRALKEGDTLLMGGMHRRVRKLFNQHRIPLHLRRALPLLCDQNDILWVPFVGVRDGLCSPGDTEITVTLPQDFLKKEG